MISNEMSNALSNQVSAEFYSAYLYLSMAAWFDARGLQGFSNWMKIQAREELTHGDKIFDYISERDGDISLAAIDAPPGDWESPLTAFKNVLEHEQKVTSMINSLVSLSRREEDYATENFLQWFVNEQVEEESTARNIVDHLSIVGDNSQALLMLDRELGVRTAGQGEPAAE